MQAVHNGERFNDKTGDVRYSMSEKDQLERPGLPRLEDDTSSAALRAAPSPQGEGKETARELPQRVSLPTVDSLRQAAPDTSLEEGGVDAESGDTLASNARRYGVDRNDAEERDSSVAALPQKR